MVGVLNPMTKWYTLVSVMILTAAGVARANGLDPIAVRQTGMALTGGDYAFIRAIVAAKGDVKPLEVPAKAVQRWGTLIPAVFPKGSEQGSDTKAKPEIWSDQAGFQKAAVAMSDAAGKLADAAKAGDAEAVAADTKVLGEACGACHRGYRAR